MTITTEHAVFLISIFVTNVGALVAFFVSLKVDNAVFKTRFKNLDETLKEKFEKLDRDVNNLGKLYRSIEKGK